MASGSATSGSGWRLLATALTSAGRAEWRSETGPLPLAAGRACGKRRSRDRTIGEEAAMLTKQAATEFLANKRIAVTGVSHKPQGHGSNAVYRRLRARDYQVFAINPNADEVEGDTTYPDLASVPGGVEAVVIATRPEHALATVKECATLGIRYVWMHRSVDEGSVSDEATEYGRQHGITVIDGGCPLMYSPTADIGHRLMRHVFTWNGRVPREV
jgi:predicted CoA-binding protein